MIQTPALDLSSDGGKFTVRLKIVGDTDATNESVVVQAGSTHYIAKPIKAGESVECVYEFSCGEINMPIAIYSQNGFPFYVDEMTVSQNVEGGKQVFYPADNREIAGGDVTSTKFEGLEAGNNEQYAYRVYAYRYFMGGRRYSTSDDVKFVDINSGIFDITVDNDTENAEYYTINGIRLQGKPTAPGLYIRRPANGKASVVKL